MCQVVCALQESAGTSGSKCDTNVTKQTSTKFSKLIRAPVDVYGGRRRNTEDFTISDAFIPQRFNRDNNDIRYNIDTNSSGSSKSPTFSPGTSMNRRPSYSRGEAVETRAGCHVREFTSLSIYDDQRTLSSKPDCPSYTEASSSVFDEQTGSGNQSRGGGSIASSIGPMSCNITVGSALTSITGVTRTRPNKSQRSDKAFDFNIMNLRLLRNINRRVDLNEMVNLEYVTGGSHSQIYSATWQNQPVIVKVNNFFHCL